MQSVIIETEGNIFSLNIPFELKDLAKALPAFSWNPKTKRWEYPASPRMASLISDKFNFCEIMGDNEYAKMLLQTPGTLSTSGLKSTLWKHQTQAAQFILDRHRTGMMNMTMGTGKTLATIALANSESPDHCLICCPHAVCRVWEAEIIQHAPGLFYPIILDKGSVADKTRAAIQGLEIAKHHGLIAVIVINYESAWREPFKSFILRYIRDIMILDESHRIKAPGGRASKFFQKVGERTEVRAALTGTPLPHSRADIYAQARAIDPTVYGTSFIKFKHRFAVMGGFENKQIVNWRNTEDFKELFHEFAITIGEEVLDLPPLTISFRHCELGKEARKVYHSLEEQYYSEIEMIPGIIDGEIAVSNTLVKLLRLQQITSGTIETEAGKLIQIDASKRNLLADTIIDIRPDEPIVVFCKFTKDLEACRAVAHAVGRTYGEISGKQKDLKGGKMPEGIDLMGVQMQAGKEGIDLTRAPLGIIFSCGFSLGDYKQCIKRLHRPGQKRAVRIIQLVARDTIDEIVYRSIKHKEQDISLVLRKDGEPNAPA